MQLTLGDVIEAAGAADGVNADPGTVLTGVSTDTRSLRPGELFVALSSEQSDGHLYLAQAATKGAVAAVVSRTVPDATIPTILTADTLVAFGKIARAWRDQFSGPVIGITGSVGKTTTKEMTAAALAPLGEVVRTEKSQNNESGVPLTLLRIDGDTAAAVVEMGMRGAGQIDYLCGIARPDIGAVTAVAENHIELLGSMDAIADAKGELLAALPSGGVAILNVSEAYFSRLRNRTGARVVTVGVEQSADLSARHVEATADGLRFEVNGQSVTIKSASRHDVSNALIALALAVEAGVPLGSAAEALSAEYRPPAMRMQVETDTAWGGTVLNDAYNAAPASVRSALETLAHYSGGRKIAFLGDMKELGDLAAQAHASLGDTIAELGGIDLLYTVGELAAGIPGASRRFADSAGAAIFAVREFSPMPGDTILVKGSRAMAMEKVVQALLIKDGEASVNG